jgi:hypothetical protein
MPKHRCAASFVGVAAFLAALGAGAPVSAHAPPQATGIFSDVAGGSSGPDWVRTNRGVILRDAAGDPLRLLCSDAYSASLSEVAPMVAVADSLVVATYNGGILRISEGGCSVELAEAPLAGRHVIDLDAASDRSSVWALVTPQSDQVGSVLVSTDAGRTWDEAGEVSGFGSALRAAPSDPSRLYVTAQLETEDGEGAHQLLVSDDGAAEFSVHPVTLLDSEVRAYVLAVDPTDAERVFLRTLPGDPSEPERLLLSEDGGQNFSDVASALGPLVLAFGGDEVWLGGKDGLARSLDGGLSFESVPQSPTHVGCLAIADGSVLACGHQDLEFSVLEMAADESNFSPALRFNQVTEQVSCGDDSEIVALCQANFEDWLEEQAPPALGAAGAEATGEGAEGHHHPSAQSGCSVRSLSNDGWSTAALLLGLSLAARRRANRPSRT